MDGAADLILLHPLFLYKLCFVHMACTYIKRKEEGTLISSVHKYEKSILKG